MNLPGESWPKGLFVCIPAFQAASTLPDLLRELTGPVPASQVCVVDDGSTDGTGSRCAHCGIACLRHEKNLGKGAALVAGFKALLERGAEGIITMDADGQHAVADLKLFADEFRLHPDTGICIGRRRFRESGMPLSRVVSNALTSGILSILCGCPVPDSQCGFRLYSARFLRAVTLTCSGFAMESEAIVMAARHGFPVRSVPVQTLYFRGASHISHVTDTLLWIIAVISAWLRRT